MPENTKPKDKFFLYDFKIVAAKLKETCLLLQLKCQKQLRLPCFSKLKK